MHGLIERLRCFLRLAPPQRWVALQICVLLPIVALTLRFIGTLGALGLARRIAGATRRHAHGLDARRCEQLVRASADSLPLPRNCLRESIVLYAILRQRGIPAGIYVGVRKLDHRLEAHAWVESPNLPRMECPDGLHRFLEFSRPILG